MIHTNIEPREHFVKTIKKTAKHPKLKVEIYLYDTPIANTGTQSIFSIISIREEDGKRYGIFCYEAILSEKEVEEAFKNIIADPTKFKN
jgi:hypothetical protein